MAEFKKFCFLELQDNHSDLQVEFDEELINDLVEEEGWIEVIRTNADNKTSHFVYSPVLAPIRCIRWTE